MIRALAAEFGKLKRSRMVLWTALAVIGYTAIGLAVFPVVEKMMAETNGLQASTSIFAQAGITAINWESGMLFIPMGVSGAWGVMLLSLVASYVFGRELREGADVAAATLPVRRESFVAAKLVVIAAWAVGLAALSVIAQVLVDLIYLGSEGFEFVFVWQAFVDTLHAMLPIYLTLPLIAWLSLTRKGYLRPMVFALVMYMLATSLIGLDAARYFPWSMPIVLVGVTWMPLRGDLNMLSWIIALAVFAVGLFLVLRKATRPAEIV